MALHCRVHRGHPLVDASWVDLITRRYGLASTLRLRKRLRGTRKTSPDLSGMLVVGHKGFPCHVGITHEPKHHGHFDKHTDDRREHHG